MLAPFCQSGLRWRAEPSAPIAGVAALPGGGEVARGDGLCGGPGCEGSLPPCPAPALARVPRGSLRRWLIKEVPFGSRQPVRAAPPPPPRLSRPALPPPGRWPQSPGRDRSGRTPCPLEEGGGRPMAVSPASACDGVNDTGVKALGSDGARIHPGPGAAVTGRVPSSAAAKSIGARACGYPHPARSFRSASLGRVFSLMGAVPPGGVAGLADEL